jgi:hypothetical protein
VLLDTRGNALRKGVIYRLFRDYQYTAVRFGAAIQHVFIEWKKRTQIEYFYLPLHTLGSVKRPMHPHAIGNNQQTITTIHDSLVGNESQAGFAKRHNVFFVGFYRFGGVGAVYFRPVKPLCSNITTGFGIVPGGFEQAFEVGAGAGIGNFDAPDVGQLPILRWS